MSTERQQIESTIVGLEAQRAMLGDAIVDAALAPLRARLASLAGAPTDEPPIQTLRQVTILFLDIVGSTALSQHLDPEETHVVMDRALVCFTGVVESHGGKVLNYAGDSVLAVFGADEAREDEDRGVIQRGMNVPVVIVGPGELLFVYKQTAKAICRAEFIRGGHLDRLKRADLHANLAAHADREVNVERRRIKLHLSLVIQALVLAFDDVDALGRTFLLANLATNATQPSHWIVTVEHEEGKLPAVLDLRRTLFRVLDRGQALVADVAAEEIPRSLRHSFDDSFTEHEGSVEIGWA